MEDKVLNPLTSRYVIKTGKVAKKLYEMLLKGEIKLSRNDTAILKEVFGDKKVEKLFHNLSEFSNIKEIKTQGTSKIYTAILEGETYYIKEVVKKNGNKKNCLVLSLNETIASKIYTDVYNVDAIKLYLIINDSNKKIQEYLVASKKIEIDTCEPISKDCRDLIENKISGAIEPLLVDCIVANWDIGSRGNVGIINSPNGKKAFRIDVGGSLLFRAMGNKRSYGDIPTEHINFFKSENKGYKLFKNINIKQVDQVYEVIEKANLDKLTRIEKNFLDIFPENKDFITNCITTVRKRHNYYISNKPTVVKFLKSKILNPEKKLSLY